ncbi:MAG: FAD:protein FMN transferase [Chitinophagaceae bacterium]|nr:FAD:protein FMN transferase [Chitinophagaceae bacterium]
MKSLKNRIFSIIFIIALFTVWYMRDIKQQSTKEVFLSGKTMGVLTYNIKYRDKGINNKIIQKNIDSLLDKMNNALSLYVPNSEISRFNTTDTFFYETEHMKTIVKESKKIYQFSEGAFDPTIGILVNAWGFGPVKKNIQDTNTVSTLLPLVGFDKISLFETFAIKQKGMSLDFNAIAGGYAVDIVADYLMGKGIRNFMVEISGEVVCQGKNKENQEWIMGIENPIDSLDDAIIATVSVKNTALATSGNYKNYYIHNGKKYSHTISPFTGKPELNTLLSTTIFAPRCTDADAIATACMVLGIQKSIALLKKNSTLDAILIFSDKTGKIKTYLTKNIEKHIHFLKFPKIDSSFTDF